jgi:hypothetical protein
MPTFDGKQELRRDNATIGEDGVLHVIIVHPHVRDDESIVYEPRCFCGELIILGFDTEEEARVAGETHKEQVTPATGQATYTSIIRRGLSGSRRSRPQ